jgi:excisionase family DNA binding protein
MSPTLANPPRRGRPPKARPWLNRLERTLKVAGADPHTASFEDLLQILQRSKLASPPARLHWTERAVVPLDPAAAVLGCSTATLYRLARTGEVELVRSGGRSCLTTSSMQRYLEQIRRAGWTPSERHLPATRGRSRSTIAPDASPPPAADQD